MSDLEKAARMVLKGLERSESALHKARAALRQALEQPAQQEAKQCAQCKKEYRCEKTGAGCPKCAPGLSVSEAEFREPIQPAPKPWVGLTDEEIYKMTVLMGINPDWKPEMEIVRSVVRNLEAKLREKNA